MAEREGGESAVGNGVLGCTWVVIHREALLVARVGYIHVNVL